jgi:hypothetical protein
MCNTTRVSIKDLPKLSLLHALWQNSPPAIWYKNNDIAPPSWGTEEALDRALSRNWHVDYIVGRVIKSDLSGEEVDPSGYDRDNGKGAFAEVVRKLREQRQAGEDKESEARTETGSDDEVKHGEENVDELDAILVAMVRTRIEEKIREGEEKEDAEGKDEKRDQEERV